MYIRSLSLRDFRSWPELDVELTPGVTVFVGRNGFGKTNIAEAIGYMAHLDSHRVNQDAPLVRVGAKDARVSVTTVNQGRELTTHLLIRPQGANQAQINRTKLKSPRELLGVLHTVLFAPEDLALVRGEPGERRRYLDDLIAARTPRLAGVKADYDKVLRQRAALLKSAGQALRKGYDNESGASALSTLDVWDAQLAHLGAQVIAARLELTHELQPLINDAYHSIAPESRPARIEYVSTVPELGEPEVIEAAMLAELGALRRREIDRGVCLVGPHRDDLNLILGDQPAKGFASHGETWSFALSMRLASLDILRATAKSDPVLILDDVFAELDAKRRARLVEVATTIEQVIITAAVEDDVPEGLAKHLTRFDVTVEDTEEGRISRLEA